MSSSTSSQRIFSVRVPESLLQQTSAAISSHLYREFGEEHSSEKVAVALARWLDQRVDLVLESVSEVLTRPGSDEALDFARVLAAVESPGLEVVPETVQIQAEELHPMFSGNRAFSADRLAAMMGYLASKTSDLYKTKLNKLLFYADLTGFYLTGRGLSGAQYVNLPYGPVPDKFEEMIDHAVEIGTIESATTPSSTNRRRSRSRSSLLNTSIAGFNGNCRVRCRMRIWVCWLYSTSVIAQPSRPARAVRPDRCR